MRITASVIYVMATAFIVLPGEAYSAGLRDICSGVGATLEEHHNFERSANRTSHEFVCYGYSQEKNVFGSGGGPKTPVDISGIVDQYKGACDALEDSKFNSYAGDVSLGRDSYVSCQHY